MPQIPILVQSTQDSFLDSVIMNLNSKLLAFIRENNISSRLAAHKPTHAILFIPLYDSPNIQEVIDKFYDKYEGQVGQCISYIIIFPFDKNKIMQAPSRQHKQFVQKQPKVIQQIMQFKQYNELVSFVAQLEQESQQILYQQHSKYYLNKSNTITSHYIENSINTVVYKLYFLQQFQETLLTQIDLIQKQLINIQFKTEVLLAPQIFQCQNQLLLLGLDYTYNIFDSNNNKSLFIQAKQNLNKSDSYFESLIIQQFFRKLDQKQLSLLDLLIFFTQLLFSCEYFSESLVLKIYKQVIHILYPNQNQMYQFQQEFSQYILTIQDKLSLNLKSYFQFQLLTSFISRINLIDYQKLQIILDKVQAEPMPIQSLLVQYSFLFNEYTSKSDISFLYNYQEVRTFQDKFLFKQKVDAQLDILVMISSQGQYLSFNQKYQILCFLQLDQISHNCAFLKQTFQQLRQQNNLQHNMVIIMLDMIYNQLCANCKDSLSFSINRYLFSLLPVKKTYDELILDKEYLFENINLKVIKSDLLGIENLHIEGAKQYFQDHCRYNIITSDKEQHIYFIFKNTQDLPFQFIKIKIHYTNSLEQIQDVDQTIKIGANHINFTPEYNISQNNQFLYIDQILISTNKNTWFLVYKNNIKYNLLLCKQIFNIKNQIQQTNIDNEVFIVQVPNIHHFKFKIINKDYSSKLFMNSYQNICIEVEQIKDIQQKIKISGSEGLQVLDHISIYDDIDFKNHIDCNCDNEYFELDLDKFYLKIPIFCRISESKLTFIIQTQTKQYIYQELLQFEQLFKVNLRVTSGRFSIQYFNQQQLLQGQTSLQLSDQQKVIRNEDYKPQQLNCLTQSISAPVSPINFIFQIKTKNFLFEINATYQNRSLVENIQPISQVRCKQSVTLQYKLYASLKAPQLFKLAFDDFYVRGPEEVSLAAGEVKIIQLTIVAKKCGQLYIPTFYSTEIESINGCELYNCRNNIINVGDYIVDLKQ